MISNHISDLVIAVREAAKQPGSDREAWNRCASSLSNALYAAEHAEMVNDTTKAPNASQNALGAATGPCICSPGMVRTDCGAKSHVG
jgi:hypothetical protein